MGGGNGPYVPTQDGALPADRESCTPQLGFVQGSAVHDKERRLASGEDEPLDPYYRP